MLFSNPKAICVLILLVAALLGFGGKVSHVVGNAVAASATTDQTTKEKEQAAWTEASRRAQLDAARNQIEARMKEFLAGKITADFVTDAIRQAHSAEASLAKSNLELEAAAQTGLTITSELFKIAKAKYDDRTISIGQFELVRATYEDFRAQEIVARSRLVNGERELVKVARELYEARFKEFMAGKIAVDYVLTASELLLKAELRVASNKTETEFFYEAHLKETQMAEKVCKANYDAGTIPLSHSLLCTYHRIEAEIMLDEVRRGK